MLKKKKIYRKPKNPISSYSFYFKLNYTIYWAKYKKIPEIHKAIGDDWNKLDEKDKAIYEELQRKDELIKSVYLEEYKEKGYYTKKEPDSNIDNMHLLEKKRSRERTRPIIVRNK